MLLHFKSPIYVSKILLLYLCDDFCVFFFFVKFSFSGLFKFISQFTVLCLKSLKKKSKS